MDLICKLSWVLLTFLFSTSKNGVEASHHVFVHLQSVEPKQVDDSLRTAYHFHPVKNWMNDPNAPLVYKGYYHLFYQYNPKGAVWGNIVWGHSVSTDLISWKALEPAIVASKPFDKFGCWSGSATFLDRIDPVILYTGIIDDKKTQVQNYAEPANKSDPLLQKWNKPDFNPIISADKSINKTNFRDPSTAWLGPDGQWRVSLSGNEGRTGIAYIYKSKDFKKWTLASHPLHYKNGTGNWECVDFFPISQKDKTLSSDWKNEKFALKISLDETKYDYYTIGSYDFTKDKYTPDKASVDGWAGLRIDYGNLYASKTFFDPEKNRRILWGWSNESSTKEEDVAKGWAGIQTIPRTLWLDTTSKSNKYQLMQWPVEEIKSLRGDKFEARKLSLPNGYGKYSQINVTTPAQADVEVSFSFEAPSLSKAEKLDENIHPGEEKNLCHQSRSGDLGRFGLSVFTSPKREEFTKIYFNIYNTGNHGYKVLMCADLTRSSLTKDVWKPIYGGWVDYPQNIDGYYKVTLRTLIDHSVVESFASGGRTVITSRVYPTLAVKENALLFVFNEGKEPVTVDVDAWSMKKPKEMNSA